MQNQFIVYIITFALKNNAIITFPKRLSQENFACLTQHWEETGKSRTELVSTIMGEYSDAIDRYSSLMTNSMKTWCELYCEKWGITSIIVEADISKKEALCGTHLLQDIYLDNPDRSIPEDPDEMDWDNEAKAREEYDWYCQ